MIKEQWQADIVVRDIVANRFLISAVANRLYPEIIETKQREKKLRETPELERLMSICEAQNRDLQEELSAWNKRAPA